jgi:hypothetical protein
MFFRLISVVLLPTFKTMVASQDWQDIANRILIQNEWCKSTEGEKMVCEASNVKQDSTQTAVLWTVKPCRLVREPMFRKNTLPPPVGQEWV